MLGNRSPRDEDGKPDTVRYEAVNAMLLNEFLKAHHKAEAQERKLQEQDSRIIQQEKQIQALEASNKEQAAAIQKVSAQMSANKAAPELVAAN